MDIKAAGQRLLRELPGSDLNLEHCRSNRQTMYNQYIESLTLLNTAMNLEDQRLFEEAKKKYIAVYEVFKQQGQCYTYSRKLMLQDKKITASGWIVRLENDINELEGANISLQKAIEQNKGVIQQKHESIEKWNNQLMDTEQELFKLNNRTEENV